MVDELELISRLREEVPLGSADRIEHAFLNSIGCPEASHARRHRWWSASGGLRVGMPTSRRRTTAIIIAATTAAGLAAGLTLLPGNTSLARNTSLPGNPSAARLLVKIADAAARQPNPLVSDSQFVYLKTWGAGSVCTAVPKGCVPGKPDEAQFWYPVSSLCATGQLLRDGKMTKFSDKSAAVDPEHFPCSGNMNYPTYRFMQGLPTDPHALLRLIEQTDHYPKAGRQGFYWAFFTIGTLLYNGPPPSVTATLDRAAALIPGVTVVPHATDTIGRSGVAIALTYQGMRTEWIFSKRTLQYLGSREINIANGSLVSQQSVQQRAIVDHAGQTPR